MGDRIARPGERIRFWQTVTPLGRGVGALGVVSLVVTWRFAWAETAIIGVACVLAFLAGAAFLLAGQARLRVGLELGTPRVVVGNAAATRVEATNESARRTFPVRLEARVGKGVAEVQVPSLAANATHDELFAIPTSRRSIVPVGPVRSVQGDPLGLVRREIQYTGTEQLYVHPRSVRVDALTTGWMRDLEGETTNDRSPSDVAFHTLREYVVGDDRRHIHWRTTARQPDGKLMVREFVDTRRAHLGLLISLVAADYANEEEFELAVSALASLGLRAIADEQEVVCIAGARQVPSFHGTSFLDSLAGLELGSDSTDLVAMATRARDLISGASVAAIIGGSTTDPTVTQRAAERIGIAVKVVTVHAHPGAESTMRTGGRGPVLDLGQLEDLPRMIWAVANQ